MDTDTPVDHPAALLDAKVAGSAHSWAAVLRQYETAHDVTFKALHNETLHEVRHLHAAFSQGKRELTQDDAMTQDDATTLFELHRVVGVLLGLETAR